MNSETKTKLRQILEKLDEDPNKWTPEEKAWFSSLPDLLPKKLRRLGDLLQEPLSICVVLPYYSIAVALFTLFLLIPSLIANVFGRRMEEGQLAQTAASWAEQITG